ncbi:hypothetical protein SAMN05216337_11017 [Bradyrhizobium brasilense]|uniref:Uncharacterized protein n=1 Tax=Bradyrhizobium brasilense TaxID=1419277 RepID=A0A1G7QNU3_9BRAD|nr:hypothetical protein [Bradyrhizobium brasilense]SDG00196.1 hypothetical protein SAMN05216337_11017 [Bradyrhizobium brasilense]
MKSESANAGALYYLVKVIKRMTHQERSDALPMKFGFYTHPDELYGGELAPQQPRFEAREPRLFFFLYKLIRWLSAYRHCIEADWLGLAIEVGCYSAREQGLVVI